MDRLPPANPPELRLIHGLGRGPSRWVRTRVWVMVALVVVAGGLWLRQPSVSSAASAAPDPRVFVVEGKAVRVRDPARASDLFSVAVATASPLSGPADTRVVVPREAVVTRRLQRFVLVGRAADRFEAVAVEVVRESNGQAVIVGPLVAGDHVVAGGAIYLFNMLVLGAVLS